MSWITVIWSMAASACLTLAAMHLGVWCRNRKAWANLLFAFTAAATAAFAGCEFWMMRAQTPEQFAAAVRWVHVPTWVIIAGLVGFVRLYLRAGRLWLGWTIIALRTLSLLLNFLVGQNLNYREVTGLRHISLLGESVSVGVGVSNPLMLVGQLSLLLFLVFVADAAVIVWRRGDRRQALVIGGSILVWVLAGAVQSVLVLWGFVQFPITASPFFMIIVVAMGYEMSLDLYRATQLSEDLRESEEQLTLAASAAGLGVWMWSIPHNQITGSENWLRLLGFAADEIVTLEKIIDRIHPDDRERMQRAALRALDGSGDYEVEYRVVLPNVPQRWIASRGRRHPDKQGKAARLVGVSLDITDRKSTEQVLRESEARFRAIADTAPVLIWMSGTDKLCNFFNKGWLDFTGRALEQELGNGWADGVHPDDLTRCLKEYVEAFDARLPFTLEYRLRRHDGEYRWVSDNGVPRYDSAQNFLGYIGSCVDLTERIRAEEKFRLAVEASPNGIVLANPQGRIVLVNATTEKLFGYLREELIGQAIEMLVPERFHSVHPGHRTGFLAAPQSRAIGAERDLFARRKDGTEFPVEIGLSPIQTAEGTLILTAIVDISARKLAEAETMRQRAELTHVARVSTMGELASSLAHELNQPLSAILSNAQAASRFLASAPPDLAEIRGALEDIAQDTKRAGEVIRQVRGFVRRDQPNLASLDLNRVILDVVRLLHSDMLIRRVRVALDLDPELRMASGDNIQLQQVLLNLALNAFDAMKDVPQSQRTVTLRTRQFDNDSIRVEVSDCGTGISPERLPSLFEPFRSSKREGLGLGLSISRSIVQAHQGQLCGENNPDCGATFYFTLPVHESELKLT